MLLTSFEREGSRERSFREIAYYRRLLFTWCAARCILSVALFFLQLSCFFVDCVRFVAIVMPLASIKQARVPPPSLCARCSWRVAEKPAATVCG